ncbi:hypothetical protein L1887_56843 [Cichorium endivia]|nr:hypothetical protein L1887_56843 [Cichorium endivia]
MLLVLVAASLAPTVLAINGRPDDSALPEECRRRGAGNESYTLSLHIAAIFVVFVSSSIGIVLPFVPLWLKSRPIPAANDEDDQHTHAHGHASGLPPDLVGRALLHRQVLWSRRHPGHSLCASDLRGIHPAQLALPQPCLLAHGAPPSPVSTLQHQAAKQHDADARLSPLLSCAVASLFAIFLVDMLLMRHIHRSRKAMDELKARRAKDKAHLESLTLLSIRPIDSPAPVDVDMAMLHNASSLPTSQAVVSGKTPDGSSRADGAKTARCRHA